MMNFLNFFLVYVSLALFFGCEKKELKNQVVVLQDEVDELENRTALWHDRINRLVLSLHLYTANHFSN